MPSKRVLLREARVLSRSLIPTSPVEEAEETGEVDDADEVAKRRRVSDELGRLDLLGRVDSELSEEDKSHSASESDDEGEVSVVIRPSRQRNGGAASDAGSGGASPTERRGGDRATRRALIALAAAASPAAPSSGSRRSAA